MNELGPAVVFKQIAPKAVNVPVVILGVAAKTQLPLTATVTEAPPPEIVIFPDCAPAA